MTYKQLLNKAKKLEESNQVFEQRTKNLNSQIERLTKENIEFENEIEQVSSEFESFKDEAEKKEELLWKLSTENETLTSKYNEIQDEVNKLIALNSKIENKNNQLKAKVENLILKNKDLHNDLLNIEERNTSFIKQFNELVKNQAEIEDAAKTIHKDTSLTSIKAEQKNYLKGKFNYFDIDNNFLSVSINGSENFYHLSSYQCSYLPIVNSRVLIFKDTNGEALIYGFDVDSMITPAKEIKAEVKTIFKSKEKVKLNNKQFGHIEVKHTGDTEIFEKLKVGQEIMLKQIDIDGDLYFYLNQPIEKEINRQEILNLIQGIA